MKSLEERRMKEASHSETKDQRRLGEEGRDNSKKRLGKKGGQTPEHTTPKNIEHKQTKQCEPPTDHL